MYDDEPYPAHFDTRPTHTSHLVAATQPRGGADPLNDSLVWRTLLLLCAFYLTLALLFVFNSSSYAAPAAPEAGPAAPCQQLAVH